MIKFLKSRSLFSVIITVLTLLYIVFIWCHSMMNADDSKAESLGVLDFMNNFIKSLGLEPNLTDHIIRKSAHFIEFALLGWLTTWTGYLNNKKIIKNSVSIGFVCLAVAVTDEFIQLYSPGRSGQVDDVVLDFSGAFVGFVFFILAVTIVNSIKKTKRALK